MDILLLNLDTLILYLCIVIISYILVQYALKFNENGYKIKTFFVYILLIIILSLVSGFRSTQVGVDTFSYYIKFLNIETYNNKEPLFGLIVRYLMMIFNDPQVVFIIFASITNALILLRFWDFKYKINLGITVTSYITMYYFQTFSGIQQWLVVSIIFYFSRYIIDYHKKEKDVLFGFVVFISMFIHKSAIIALGLYLFSFFPWNSVNRRRKNKLLIGGVVLFPFVILLLVQGMFSIFSNYLYILEDQAGYKLGLMSTVKLGLMCLIIIEYRRYKNQNIEKKEYIYLFRRLFLLELFWILVLFIGYYFQNVSRAGWYYAIYTPVFYGFVWRNFKNNTLIKIGIFIIMFYTILSYFIVEGSKIVPYVPFWLEF